MSSRNEKREQNDPCAKWLQEEEFYIVMESRIKCIPVSIKNSI